MPDISYYQHDDDDDEDASNANDVSLMGDSFAGQGTFDNRTLSQAHLEFLKTMVGYRKKWTPYEIKTSTEIRRIIGSKEYEVLRKQEGMPLPSVKTLRKYKRCAIENGDDNVNSATLRPEKSTRIHEDMPANNSSEFGEDNDDLLAYGEEPEGHFDINNLSEEQIDFLQSMSGNSKGFSDYELQRSLELKNELGAKDYEILRKQECLHIPTLSMLNRYERDNGLEEAGMSHISFYSY
jgi:hypothetical protein